MTRSGRQRTPDLGQRISGRTNILALGVSTRSKDDRALAIVSERSGSAREPGYQYEAQKLLSTCWFASARTPSEHFQTIKYRIVAGDRDAERKRAFAEAILKVRVDDEVKFEAAEGHGPVNAWTRLFRKHSRVSTGSRYHAIGRL